MVFLITWLDLAHGPSREPADLYDVPIVVAATSFGLTAALCMITGCSILYCLTLWYFHVGFSIVDVGQIMIFLLLGFSTAQLVTEYLRVDDLGSQLLQLNAKLSQRITEAVAAEREAQKRLRDGQRLTMLGEAAAQIAHEIKNPLVAIGGFAARVQKQLPRDHTVQAALGIIVQEVRRLEMLLKDLLMLGSPKEWTGGQADLNEILGEVLTLAQPSIQQRSIRVSMKALPQPMTIAGNAAHLKSALLNVVLNAIQAMPEAGELTLSLRCTLKDSKHGAEITVKDTGTGIAPADLKKVFEPFYTSKPGGTGLGLAVVKKAIEAHGGNVEITSRPGTGTLVTMWLPFHNDTAVPVAEMRRMASDPSSSSLPG